MNDTLFSLLRWTGVSLAGAFALFMGYHNLISIDRPVWVGTCLLLATAGAVTGFLILQRVRQRRNEHRLVEPEAARPSVTPQINRRKGIEALRLEWKTALQFLRRSGLKKRGNPLYVLPWHVVIGAEGSGKTAALRGARLSSFAGSNPTSAVLPTEHCEWSFFEQAIVIDTAGRYTTQAEPECDTEEWNTFIDLLLRYRRREPLNGLTLTVPADQLLNASSDILESAGKNLRKRIDELMRGVGAKFPVYVLITKGDLIPGMARFCERLSERGLNQAMGCLNEDSTPDAASFLNTTFITLSERLKNMRLILASQPGAETLDPALLVFPETFGKIQGSLGAFLRGAFQENMYQETPFLRGIFLTSATASGRSAFLNEFFSKVLPTDRGLSVPTRRALSWRKGTLSLGMITWLALSTAACGLLSYSFMKNMRTLSVLREADQEFSRLSNVREDIPNAILMMSRLSETLLVLDASQRGWLSNLGLRDAAGVEAALKQKVSRQFRQEILGPTDQQYNRTMTAFVASSSDELFSQYVAHLVGRLSLLRERANGTDLRHSPKTLPTVPSLQTAGRETDLDTKEKFGQLYVNTLFWTSDTTGLNQETATLQAQLKHLLALKGQNPRWLIVWAASQNSVPPATLSQAWKGRSLSNREPAVPGLFSLQGKSLIDSFHEIDHALDDPAISSGLKAGFERWYHDNAFQTWHQFVAEFPRGAETLPSAEAWRQTASRMASSDGPYAVLLKHLLQEFEPVAVSDCPAWMRHVRQLGELQKTPAYWKYQQSLEKAAKAVSDPASAIQATSQAFDPATAPGTSVFGIAFESLAKLKANSPKDLAGDAIVWKLISGPLEFVWDSARRDTASHLQADWQSKVLSAATGLDGAQAMPVLLTKDGPALAFAKDQAGPYMQWTQGNGFSPKTLYGGSIPFAGAFFPFMNGAIWVASVNNLQVAITAESPVTNEKAKRIPHVAKLTLRCSGAKDQVLTNRRLRVLEKSFNTVEQTFSWTPACTETRLDIDVAGTHLTRSYPGPYGFFAFLHDFKEGRHTYVRNDFPDQAKSLAELGVESIAMHYRLKGAPNFAAPKAAPAKIAWSWENKN